MCRCVIFGDACDNCLASKDSVRLVTAMWKMLLYMGGEAEQAAPNQRTAAVPQFARWRGFQNKRSARTNSCPCRVAPGPLHCNEHTCNLPTALRLQLSWCPRRFLFGDARRENQWWAGARRKRSQRGGRDARRSSQGGCVHMERRHDGVHRGGAVG